MTEQVSSKRLTVAQQRWNAHMQQQAVSGLSIAAYARSNGLAISTFYAMRRRLLGLTAIPASSQSPLFQAMTVLPGQPANEGPLTLTFEMQGDVHCSVQTDIATGAALLRALAGGKR